MSKKPEINAEREFKREDRYIVIKRSDLVACSGDVDRSTGMSEAEVMLRNHMEGWDIPTRECLVIESDWPEYEPAWAMIEARMTGKAQPASVAVPEGIEPLQLRAVIQKVIARERMRPLSLPDSEVAANIYQAIVEQLTIYEDVYDQLAEMIEPHVDRVGRSGCLLPASVVDSMRIMLDAYLTAPSPVQQAEHNLDMVDAHELWSAAQLAPGEGIEDGVARIASLMGKGVLADTGALVEALEKLARLGNGDQYGNSDGNMIAREALAAHRAGGAE